MRTAVAIRHVHFEDLGSFEIPLKQAGYQIQYVEGGIDDLKAMDPFQMDLLVSLGGPIGAYEEKEYPFLSSELLLFERRMEKDLPTLGICLGAQLMARALGAKVYPGLQKEIGWKPILLTEAGKNSCLKFFTGQDANVFHWHGDTFDLPENAVLLASTEICPHQAFSCGKGALALQFHPEIVSDKLEKWLIGHAHELSSQPGLIAKLRDDALRYGDSLKTHAGKCLNEWLQTLEKNRVHQSLHTV